ncbi:carbohydrate ABC transporter permease [Anaerobium acetethylicum]|uniref:Raffinose/stachyose/melibiose transport system permease protein n=1 Tax=Anaerobium acetethylicum TaxID=1619234 RepID=A0A1D3TTD3_9FIRM|nr:carbohydrate ABC transporter permease [Anaerobium acetethylicum]SCP97247.1 raffinose/stachyose/melibiose transport system permease protein [Anaerobium acetethylicum]
MVSTKGKKVRKNISTHLVLIFISCISLGPILLVVLNSFKSHAEIVRNPLSLPTVFHFENYVTAWETGKFSTGFINSMILSGITIIIVLIAASLAGYVLAGKRIKGSDGVLVYFMMAMTVPIQLFLFPLYYAMASLDLIGNIPAVSLILSATSMPLAVFLMRTFFLNVPRELEEAARIDGASTWQVIWHVMRPVVSPGLITVAVIVGLQSWNEYLITSTFLQGEDSFTATLGFLSMNGTYSSDQAILMAAAVIMIAPIVIFFVCIQKYFVDGMASGAVKG